MILCHLKTNQIKYTFSCIRPRHNTVISTLHFYAAYHCTQYNYRNHGSFIIFILLSCVKYWELTMDLFPQSLRFARFVPDLLRSDLLEINEKHPYCPHVNTSRQDEVVEKKRKWNNLSCKVGLTWNISTSYTCCKGGVLALGGAECRFPLMTSSHRKSGCPKSSHYCWQQFTVEQRLKILPYQQHWADAHCAG